MLIYKSFPCKGDFFKRKNVQTTCEKSRRYKIIVQLARRVTRNSKKLQKCPWDHFWSSVYYTCQDLKLLIFGVVSTGQDMVIKTGEATKEQVHQNPQYVQLSNNKIRNWMLKTTLITLLCMIHLQF